LLAKPKKAGILNNYSILLRNYPVIRLLQTVAGEGGKDAAAFVILCFQY
jgi:hypothetical protein